MENEIVVNGTAYIAKSSATTGNRAVVVVDRGWIFIGDVDRKDKRITLTRAVWVFRWEEIGLDGFLANPKSTRVKLRPIAQNVDLPEDSEIFCIPVNSDFGL